jgi:hypothetical protein
MTDGSGNACRPDIDDMESYINMLDDSISESKEMEANASFTRREDVKCQLGGI